MAYDILKSKLAEAPKSYKSGMPEALEQSMLGKYQASVESVKLQKGKAQRWAKGKALLGETTRSLLKESFDPNSPLTGMEMQNRLLTAWAQAGVGEDIISKFATPQMMEKLMDAQQSFFNRMRSDRTQEMEGKPERAGGTKNLVSRLNKISDIRQKLATILTAVGKKPDILTVAYATSQMRTATTLEERQIWKNLLKTDKLGQAGVEELQKRDARYKDLEEYYEKEVGGYTYPVEKKEPSIPVFGEDELKKETERVFGKGSYKRKK